MFQTLPTRTKGIIYALVGICLFSVKAVFVKLAYQYEVSSIHLLLFRMLFAFPFYLVIAFRASTQNTRQTKTKHHIILVILAVFGYYLATYLDFVSLNFIDANLARLILFVYPTIVVLLSFLAFRKKVTTKQVLAIAITYIGVVIIFSDEVQLQFSNKIYLGGLLTFLSALAYAVYAVGSERLISKFGAVKYTSYIMVIACTCGIAHYLIADRASIINYNSMVYVYALLMAVFSTIIPSFFVSLAIRDLGASNFSIFGGLGPIATIILAFIFLGETLTIIQIIGSLVVIGGVYVVSKKD